MSLAGKTLFITGASRGIGKAIALRAARDGANVVIAAKTTEPHPKLEGTIYSAADEVEAAGGKALPIVVDIRFEDVVEQAVAQAAQHFGGVDILVNNASAIMLTDTPSTPMKRFDLMHQVNVRGTFLCGQKCLPYLLKSPGPAHILTLSPPLNLKPHWFGNHVAYTMSKYGMSMCTLGWAAEFRGRVAANSLWPRTTIATAAVQNLLGGDAMMSVSRTPEIMGDAAHAVLCKGVGTSGNFFLDEDVLRADGVADFSRYAAIPGTTEFQLDLFLDAE